MSIVTAMGVIDTARTAQAQTTVQAQKTQVRENEQGKDAGYMPATQQTSPGVRGHVSTRLLDRHNAERRRLGLAELRWSSKLASNAAQWGETLTRKGYLQHSDRSSRGGAGENLWMGTAGFWSIDAMLDMFLEERKNYRHEHFPDVSTTGAWKDVGHYTQIIWRDTREVGCAVTSGRGNDVLVCRYFPAGNISGEKAY